MGRILLAIGVTLVAIAAPSSRADTPPTDAESSPERPNIVLIFADDLGYGDLGCYGSKVIRTPNLDRMAAEGTRFTNFYAQAVCGPSRAALMTGCYPIRVAEPGNTKHQHTILHPEEVTVAEVLKRAGYATACIGKWHLGARDPASPTGWRSDTMPNSQGFDHYFGTPLFNGTTPRVAQSPFRSQLLRNEEVVQKAIQSWDSITGLYTQESLRFIRENRDRPFFLYVAHNMPHIPLGAGPDFKGRNPAGPYADTVEELDWSVGQVVQLLTELKLDRRTLVLFTSDNGPWIETTPGNRPGAKPLIPREHSGSAGPLRGYKMLTWDGGSRVPLIAWRPGTVAAGATAKQVATTMDLLPTLGRMAGVKPPADRTIDGVDIKQLLVDAAAAEEPHEAVYFYCFTHLQAVRSGKWKLVRPRPEHPKWTGWSGRFVGNGVADYELYDLHVDPGESRNVASQHPAVVDRLKALIEKGRADLGDYDKIGSGARFFDDGVRRPESKQWISQDGEIGKE